MTEEARAKRGRRSLDGGSRIKLPDMVNYTPERQVIDTLCLIEQRKREEAESQRGERRASPCRRFRAASVRPSAALSRVRAPATA